MPKKHLRIATRNSQLAMWQAKHICEILKTLHPDLNVEILGMTTQGDRILDKSLSKIGGKGLFTKELELALIEKRAEIAVHCVKDMPYDIPEPLIMPVICERGSPWDALVSNSYSSIEALPEGGRVGTSSLRRQAQLLALRPDLEVKPLRGNLTTRLAHLDQGHFDAIILAAAGLERLGWQDRIRARIAPKVMLPAVGQGALGIEIRADDSDTHALITPLIHSPTALCITAERAMNAALAGSCQVPIGGFATLNTTSQILELTGLVATPCGTRVLRASHSSSECTPTQAQHLGKRVAQELKDKGAEEILDTLRIPERV